MFYFIDLVFYNSDPCGPFIRDSALQFSTSGKVSENSTEPTELDRVGPAWEQASVLAGLVGLTSSMVGTFFVGQDFRRHPSKSIAPLPTPALIAQRAGDVEVGGGAPVRIPLEYSRGWRGSGVTHCLGSCLDLLLCPRVSSSMLLEYVPFVLPT